jgi:hypothetical protein
MTSTISKLEITKQVATIIRSVYELEDRKTTPSTEEIQVLQSQFSETNNFLMKANDVFSADELLIHRESIMNLIQRVLKLQSPSPLTNLSLQTELSTHVFRELIKPLTDHERNELELDS